MIQLFLDFLKRRDRTEKKIFLKINQTISFDTKKIAFSNPQRED